MPVMTELSPSAWIDIEVAPAARPIAKGAQIDVAIVGERIADPSGAGGLVRGSRFAADESVLNRPAIHGLPPAQD